MTLQFKALLTDIEGTTTSIEFVKNTLFPYANEHVEEFLRTMLENPDNEQEKMLQSLRSTSNELAAEDGTIAKIEPNDEGNVLVKKLVKNVHIFTRQDRKLTSLKTLQGMIWKQGYQSGDLKADVYPDVPEAFKKLMEQRLPVYIYSSGSVEAQKLLFGHTNFGDLRGYISDYFDTSIGQKNESTSYQEITKQIGFDPPSVLFLTDVEKEAVAAHIAGLQVRLVVREGNVPLEKSALDAFQTIRSFEELFAQ